MAIKEWKQVLGRLLRRRAQERERIRSAVWREITRREWLQYTYDYRQDNGKGILHNYYLTVMDNLSSPDAEQQAAGVLRHRRLQRLVRRA